MKLDEAIKHAEEVVESCEIGNPKKRSKLKCASEHRQLAEWLKELKAYKEQEPCEDAISREAALEAILTRIPDFCGGDEGGNLIGRNETASYIRNLPSVTPKQKKGKFKLVQRGKHIDLCCSNCGAVRIKDIAYNYPTDELSKMEDFKNLLKHSEMSYCPYCGAKITESEE